MSLELSYLTYLAGEDFTPVRSIYEHLMEKGYELDSIRKLHRKLRPLRESKQEGKKWFAKLNEQGEQYYENLVSGASTSPLVDDRGLHLVNRVDRSSWAPLMREVKSLGLQTAFIPVGAKLVVHTKEGEVYDLPQH